MSNTESRNVQAPTAPTARYSKEQRKARLEAILAHPNAAGANRTHRRWLELLAENETVEDGMTLRVDRQAKRLKRSERTTQTAARWWSDRELVVITERSRENGSQTTNSYRLNAVFDPEGGVQVLAKIDSILHPSSAPPELRGRAKQRISIGSSRSPGPSPRGSVSTGGHQAPPDSTSHDQRESGGVDALGRESGLADPSWGSGSGERDDRLAVGLNVETDACTPTQLFGTPEEPAQPSDEGQNVRGCSEAVNEPEMGEGAVAADELLRELVEFDGQLLGVRDVCWLLAAAARDPEACARAIREPIARWGRDGWAPTGQRLSTMVLDMARAKLESPTPTGAPTSPAPAVV